MEYPVCGNCGIDAERIAILNEMPEFPYDVNGDGNEHDCKQHLERTGQVEDVYLL